MGSEAGTGVQPPWPARPRGAADLRRAMAAGMVHAPGVADALAARIAEAAGFDVALYVSGGAVARSLGVPDVGLVGAAEMVRRVAEIRAVTGAALVVDADTGYGGALAAARAVAALERAGAAAVHLEDQAEPKRCAQYGGVRLAEAAEAAARIRAAASARAGDLVVIARTDALPVAGLAEAVARLRRYAAAGADMAFAEGVRTAGDIAALAESVPLPLVLQSGDLERAGIGPEEAARAGCRLLLHPADLQRAAIRAMARTAAVLRRDGTGVAARDLMASDEEREGAVGRTEYAAFEAWAHGADASP
jgi:2-methylisocitrate lyase-like PEP mutase family enzyme